MVVVVATLFGFRKVVRKTDNGFVSVVVVMGHNIPDNHRKSGQKH